MSLEDKKRRIEDAAMKLLLEKGYAATSMLSIAKAAKTSNQTMYRLYANKQTLFEALVSRNSSQVAEKLTELETSPISPREKLERLGIELLTMLLSERAIVLNRAAAADVDDTGQLGPALAKNGRDKIAPIVAKFCADYLKETRPEISESEIADLTHVYLKLLIGDLQIRRATGAISQISHDEIGSISVRAIDLIQKLV